MISTFIGASHFENGVLSIEPNSRNLIIYADDSPRDNSISVRGPYTIDSAIENESNVIRMPSDAMMSLGVKLNDTIMIDGEIYTINETRLNEQDLLRLPLQVKDELGLEDGDVIQNSRLKEIFAGSIITHNYGEGNITLDEKYIVSARDKSAFSVEIFVNNKSIASSSGILKDSYSYDISVNGEYVTSVSNLKNTKFKYDNNTVKVVFKDINSTSMKRYVKDYQGSFLNFNI